MLSGLDKLPSDLKAYVKEDNGLFDKEMEEWDKLQARTAQQEKLALAAAAAATAAAETTTSHQPMSTEPSPPDSWGEDQGSSLQHLNTTELVWLRFDQFLEV